MEHKIDWDKVKGELRYLAVAEHAGDTANGLLDLGPALGFKTAWSDSKSRVVYDFEVFCKECGAEEADQKYGSCESYGHPFEPVNAYEEATNW